MKLPKGLLSFARKHRQYNHKRDERHHNYIIWLSIFNPVWLDKYLSKYPNWREE